LNHSSCKLWVIFEIGHDGKLLVGHLILSSSCATAKRNTLALECLERWLLLLFCSGASAVEYGSHHATFITIAAISPCLAILSVKRLHAFFQGSLEFHLVGTGEVQRPTLVLLKVSLDDGNGHKHLVLAISTELIRFGSRQHLSGLGTHNKDAKA